MSRTRKDPPPREARCRHCLQPIDVRKIDGRWLPVNPGTVKLHACYRKEFPQHGEA